VISPRAMRHWPLTVRLTLFFSLALAVILGAVAFAMGDQLDSLIDRKDAAELRRSVQIQQAILEKLQHAQQPDTWQRAWREQADRTDRLAFRIIDPSGRIGSESPDMVVPQAAFPAPSSGMSVRRWHTPQGVQPVEHLLLTSFPVEFNKGERWVIEAALEVTKSREVVDTFRTRLILFSCIAVLVAGLLNWLLARGGLAPLRAMRAEIERINAEQLNRRIGEHAWPADVRVLAETFDGMLSRLETSFDQLTRFSSDVAHEFRTPINNLVAAASVTLSRERPVAEYQETLMVVVEEGERLSRMISAMLFLARADNAQQAMHRERLSARDELDKVAEFFDALAESQQINLTVTGDGTLFADPLLVRRALSNLIANALRYTPSGGTVRLAVNQRAGALCLSVRDSGSGIEARYLPQLFDRFFRADAARSGSESSGLGLAVVRSIMELHGGTVEVDSRLGEGAFFTLVFPAVADSLS
jgi:two-component system heavy metal sensor histidine kinase CusS